MALTVEHNGSNLSIKDSITASPEIDENAISLQRVAYHKARRLAKPDIDLEGQFSGQDSFAQERLSAPPDNALSVSMSESASRSGWAPLPPSRALDRDASVVPGAPSRQSMESTVRPHSTRPYDENGRPQLRKLPIPGAER